MIFENDTSIGPGGVLQLAHLPFPEGWQVHVKVEPKAEVVQQRSGFAFGLHSGMIEIPADFDEPLPDSFWLGTDTTGQD